MSFVEATARTRMDDFLVSKAEEVGLDSQYVIALPWQLKEKLALLDEIAVVKPNGERGVSMFEESMMGAAWTEHHSKLIRSIYDNPDDHRLAELKRDVIRGSLLSDLGKVANPELAWLYGSLNFDQNNIETKLREFLMRKYGEAGYGERANLNLRQLPYSVAMDFHREYYNGYNLESDTEWDQKRLACDLKLKELGFKINTPTNQYTAEREASFHDVLTGAHLAVLDTLLEEFGIKDDPEWERAIFIARNHHLSRGFVGGLPVDPGQNFLNSVLAGEEIDSRILSLALIEEAVDGAFAATFRLKRSGDARGVNARRRILDNLRQSEEEGRMSHLERACLVMLLRRPDYGRELSESVKAYVEKLRIQSKAVVS
jgi:hypothetical protein